MLGLSISSKWDWDSHIVSIAKTSSRKIRVLIHSLRFLFLSITLPSSFAWTTVAMSGLVLLIATWMCRISHRNKYGVLFAPHLLLLLNHLLIVKIYLANVFYIGITLINVHLNLLNWFLFVILVGGPILL